MTGTEQKNTSKERLGIGSWLILIGAIGLLAAVALPNFVRARTTECQNACVNHLRELADAKKNYVMKRGAPDSGFQMGDLVGSDRTIKTTPVCPAGGSYRLGRAEESPTCSIGGDHTLP